MKHELIKLPYKADALEPVISQETMEYHYGKHHQKYVDTLNELIKDSEYESMALMEIIKSAQGAIFNNAAQVFNHNFYWLGLSKAKTTPSLELQTMIERKFGSMQKFKEEFVAKAAKNFGSGWTWLVLRDKNLEILNTSNADTPIKDEIVPLLTCDVWEHAYYIDYRNARPSYLDEWFGIINWNFVSQNLAQSMNNKEDYIQMCNYNSDVCDYIDKFYYGETVAT